MKFSQSEQLGKVLANEHFENASAKVKKWSTRNKIWKKERKKNDQLWYLQAHWQVVEDQIFQPESAQCQSKQPLHLTRTKDIH